MKKLNFEFVKNSIEAEGYKLLSKQYVNANALLDVLCPNGHDWKISAAKWSVGRRCKYCNRAMHINDVRNSVESEGYKLLTDQYVNSKTKLELVCPEGHTCSISWSKWKAGIRCKSCYVNSLKTQFTDIKIEIDKLGYKLLTPDEKFENARSYVTCKCDRGHEFTTRWSNFLRTMKCPVCNIEDRDNKARLNFSEIEKSFNVEGYELKYSSYTNAFAKLDYVCPKGHEHSIRWNDWQQGIRCPYCSISTSNGEEEVGKFLEEYFDDVSYRNREIIKPYELDIVVPSKKIAIEYCGLYWHSEKNGKDSMYHLIKLNKCIEKGYRLITIFEDEWVFKKNIVKSRLKNIFDLNEVKVIYGRNCTIKEISVERKNSFLNENHIQGSDISGIRLGAFHDDQMVAAMTFSKRSVAKGKKHSEGYFELNRYCCDKNCRVIGIASKLFKYFLRNYTFKNVISYADRRWSDGSLYYRLGFIFDGYTKSGYWYTKDGLNRVHRFNLRKKSYESNNISEKELRESEGYYRIWDCGNLKFKFNA